MASKIDSVLFGLLRTADIKPVAVLPTASSAMGTTVFFRTTDRTFWMVAADGITWEQLPDSGDKTTLDNFAATARAALGGGHRIDPADIGSASYDTTGNYWYLSFLSTETLAYLVGTNRNETVLTFTFDNASGAETGDAHIRILDGAGTVLAEADVTFAAGQTGVEQTFDLSASSLGDEIIIQRDVSDAGDTLSAEVYGRMGTWY